jgi:hypothetical protein
MIYRFRIPSRHPEMGREVDLIGIPVSRDLLGGGLLGRSEMTQTFILVKSWALR